MSEENYDDDFSNADDASNSMSTSNTTVKSDSHETSSTLPSTTSTSSSVPPTHAHAEPDSSASVDKSEASKTEAVSKAEEPTSSSTHPSSTTDTPQRRRTSTHKASTHQTPSSKDKARSKKKKTKEEEPVAPTSPSHAQHHIPAAEQQHPASADHPTSHTHLPIEATAATTRDESASSSQASTAVTSPHRKRAVSPSPVFHGPSMVVVNRTQCCKCHTKFTGKTKGEGQLVMLKQVLLKWKPNHIFKYPEELFRSIFGADGDSTYWTRQIVALCRNCVLEIRSLKTIPPRTQIAPWIRQVQQEQKENAEKKWKQQRKEHMLQLQKEKEEQELAAQEQQQQQPQQTQPTSDAQPQTNQATSQSQGSDQKTAEVAEMDAFLGLTPASTAPAPSTTHKKTHKKSHKKKLASSNSAAVLPYLSQAPKLHSDNPDELVPPPADPIVHMRKKPLAEEVDATPAVNLKYSEIEAKHHLDGRSNAIKAAHTPAILPPLKRGSTSNKKLSHSSSTPAIPADGSSQATANNTTTSPPGARSRSKHAIAGGKGTSPLSPHLPELPRWAQPKKHGKPIGPDGQPIEEAKDNNNPSEYGTPDKRKNNDSTPARVRQNAIQESKSNNNNSDSTTPQQAHPKVNRKAPLPAISRSNKKTSSNKDKETSNTTPAKGKHKATTSTTAVATTTTTTTTTDSAAAPAESTAANDEYTDDFDTATTTQNTDTTATDDSATTSTSNSTEQPATVDTHSTTSHYDHYDEPQPTVASQDPYETTTTTSTAAEDSQFTPAQNEYASSNAATEPTDAVVATESVETTPVVAPDVVAPEETTISHVSETPAAETTATDSAVAHSEEKHDTTVESDAVSANGAHPKAKRRFARDQSLLAHEQEDEETPIQPTVVEDPEYQDLEL